MSTEVSRMMDKLHARCDAAKLIDNPPASDRKAIHWLRKSANVIESDDKRHQIERRYAQTRVCSDSAGYVYLVFRKGSPDKLLGIYFDPEQAKAACELDREEPCETVKNNSIG